MSLTDASIIDLVTRLPGKPARVALVIFDSGEISDDFERENALRKKLSACLMFVASGQFAKAYPALSNMELSVKVVCSVPPTDGMKLIQDVHRPNSSDLRLPVHIIEENEFRVQLGLVGASANQR